MGTQENDVTVDSLPCREPLGGFECLGFSLYEPDDHFLFLMHYGVPVAVFSQAGVSRESILRACAGICGRTLGAPQ
jgi:hypothetical protein